MKLGEALARAGLPDRAEAFGPGWDESQMSMPADVPFLRPDFVRRACRETWLAHETTEQAVAAAECIRANEGLRALAWYCHDSLFRSYGREVRRREWRVPMDAMGDLAGFFYVVVLLSGTPQRQEIHRRRGIPEAVVRETVLDLEICIRTERQDELRGLPGITAYILGWLLGHWRGNLYRLGRLQFVPGRFGGKLRVFRHRVQRTVLALSEDGVKHRADGKVDGAGQVFDPSGAWTATLAETPEAWQGYPISPRGFAVRRIVELPKADWSPALTPGEPILEVHIATGEPMDYDRCGASVRQAMEFFPKHFPDRPFLAFVCHSWILDPQFEELLPASSNLVRFEQEMYLYPLGGGSGEIPWQVKLRDGQTPETAPNMTTMQRAFYGHLARGGRFFNSGCFLLPEDFDWGRQVYRRQRLPCDSGGARPEPTPP